MLSLLVDIPILFVGVLLLSEFKNLGIGLIAFSGVSLVLTAGFLFTKKSPFDLYGNYENSEESTK